MVGVATTWATVLPVLYVLKDRETQFPVPHCHVGSINTPVEVVEEARPNSVDHWLVSLGHHHLTSTSLSFPLCMLEIGYGGG